MQRTCEPPVVGIDCVRFGFDLTFLLANKNKSNQRPDAISANALQQCLLVLDNAALSRLGQLLHFLGERRVRLHQLAEIGLRQHLQN